jgi:hypothetical protein
MSFKRFDTEDISISAESITAPAWTGQQYTLGSQEFNTSPQTGTLSAQYYYNIYKESPNPATPTILPEVQFSIAYGNRLGNGSRNLTSVETGKSPSSIIYGQYRNLINGDENEDFNFGSAVTPQSIYVIAVNRSRFKEKLLPGSFNLTLRNGQRALKLTDNSSTATTISYKDSGRVYDIVSGSNGVESSSASSALKTASGSYGYFLPDVGVAVLNANALADNTFGIGLVTNEAPNTLTNNIPNFLATIRSGGEFSLRSEETITSNYIFVRVRNSEFNYSTNPSNISGSGELRHNIMVNSPQAYITTVGLYNDSNDLLAVAKLSRPLLKDFTKEALVRIKLDY